MVYRTAYICFDEVDHTRSSRVEFSDVEVGVQKYLADLRTLEIIVEIIIKLNQFPDLELVFRIHGMQFFIQ